MEKAKALIAVVLFIATILFTALTKEAKPNDAGRFQTINNPVSNQGTHHIHPVLFAK